MSWQLKKDFIELQKEQAREIELLKKAYEDMVMKLELALQVEQDMMKDIKTLKAFIDEEIRVLKKQKVGSHKSIIK
ncbi:hypothetical protein Tco_0330381, partial [Tanacetum coccineum]